MFVIGVWLCLLFSTLNCQFVVENFTPTCLISGLTFFRKTWEITEGNYNMILNVCDYIPDSACGQHQKVCLTHSQNPLKIHGSEFINGTDEQLILNSGQCNVSIQLSCSDHLMEKPQLHKSGKCDFEVSMMTVDCAPKCMINYRGHLMNLRPLKNTYHVHSKNETFSVALCGSNQDCHRNGISSCIITDRNATTPLSSVDTEQLTYRDEKNEIKLHGSFKPISSKRKKIEFEVLIKCNWTLSTPYIIYKQPRPQGKKYSFLMETKEGCVKVPPQCVAYDKFYTYNVTNLHKTNGYWIVEDVPGNKMMILNVCGLLKPGFLTKDNNNCIKSSSQICEINNNTYTNRGSFHQDLSIINEKLSISLTDGDFCDGSPRKQLRTEINFICSKSEGKPTFIKEENCVTYLSWKTSSACPKIMETRCENKRLDTHHNNCTLETSGKFYNLSGLYKKDGKYTVKDKHDGNLEYLLNVCGSVIDDEAPCMMDAMVAHKNSSETNLRHKVKSYGGMRNISENAEGLLVIETFGGANCGRNGTITYCRSTVYFKCSKYEEGPMLLSKTDLTLEFLWRTNNSCPEIKDNKRCGFKNPFTGFLIDFTQFKSTQLKIKSTNLTYFFDFCGNDKSKCSERDCKYIALNKTIVEYGNETYLEVNINEHCNSSENQFNKTVFKLTCDEILYNEHFEMKYIKNCILLFELQTHLACLDKEPVIKMDKKLSDNTEYKVQTSYKEQNSNFHEQIKENHKVIDVPHDHFITQLNCLVKNPSTGYQFNINNLNLNLTSLKCPEIIFNRTKRYVSLIFYTEKKCRQTSVDSDEFQSIVILNCPNESNDSPRKTEEPLKSSECLETVILQRIEACKLLEETISPKLSSGSVAGIIIGVIAILVSVIGLAVYSYSKWRVRDVRSSYHSMPYNKDADL